MRFRVVVLVLFALLPCALNADLSFICQTGDISEYFSVWVRLQAPCPDLPFPLSTFHNIRFSNAANSTNAAYRSPGCAEYGALSDAGNLACDFPIAVWSTESPCSALAAVVESGWGCAPYSLGRPSLAAQIRMIEDGFVKGCGKNESTTPSSSGNVGWGFACAYYDVALAQKLQPPEAPPVGWNCSHSWWRDGSCHCGCGAWDPDCGNLTLPIFDGRGRDVSLDSVCECPGNVLSPRPPVVARRKALRNAQLQLAGHESSIYNYKYSPDFAYYSRNKSSRQAAPDSWRCPNEYFAQNDACDCACGSPDLDCDNHQPVVHCPTANDTCTLGRCVGIGEYVVMSPMVVLQWLAGGAALLAFLILFAVLTFSFLRSRREHESRSWWIHLAESSSDVMFFVLIERAWFWVTWLIAHILLLVIFICVVVQAVAQAVYIDTPAINALSFLIMMSLPACCLVPKWAAMLDFWNPPKRRWLDEGSLALQVTGCIHYFLQPMIAIVFCFLIVAFSSTAIIFVFISLLLRWVFNIALATRSEPPPLIEIIHLGPYRFLSPLHLQTIGTFLLPLAQQLIAHHSSPALWTAFAILLLLDVSVAVLKLYRTKLIFTAKGEPVDTNKLDRIFDIGHIANVAVGLLCTFLVGIIMLAEAWATLGVLTLIGGAYIVGSIWAFQRKWKRRKVEGELEVPLNRNSSTTEELEEQQRRTMKNNCAAFYPHFLFSITFVVIFGLLVVGTFPKSEATAVVADIAVPGGLAGYATCTTRFPQQGPATAVFTLLDVSFMARLAYIDADKQQGAAAIWFPPFQWPAMEIRQVALKSKVVLSKIRFPLWNTTVVAIRGSVTSADWLEDAYIWSAAALLRTARTITFLPGKNFDAYIVDWLMYNYNDNYVDTAKAEVQRMMREGEFVMITGHSLGGGLANLIGAMLRVQSVGFEAPGIAAQRRRYKFDLDAAARFTFNTYVEGDPVPFADFQVGNVQQLRFSCFAFECHSLVKIIDHLRTDCGDFVPRGT